MVETSSSSTSVSFCNAFLLIIVNFLFCFVLLEYFSFFLNSLTSRTTNRLQCGVRGVRSEKAGGRRIDFAEPTSLCT